jgi:hypothetical protein
MLLLPMLLLRLLHGAYQWQQPREQMGQKLPTHFRL